MKNLVLTEQAKQDLNRLDHATRIRMAAAMQRLVLENAGNIKKLQGIDPPNTASVWVTGVFVFPSKMRIQFGSIAFKTAKMPTAEAQPFKIRKRPGHLGTGVSIKSIRN